LSLSLAGSPRNKVGGFGVAAAPWKRAEIKIGGVSKSPFA
jgi:hypothetical protein